jgi:hypothetical protein
MNRLENEIARFQLSNNVSRPLAFALMCQEGRRMQPDFLTDLAAAEGQQLVDEVKASQADQSIAGD